MSEENGRRLLGGIIVMLAKVVYICYCLLRLAPGSHDLSQAKKRITVVHKMTLKIVLDEQGSHFE